MDASTVLCAFLKDLQTAFPEYVAEELCINLDRDVPHVEDTYLKHIIPIIKKDETFFDEERTIFGVNLSQLWKTEGVSDETKEAIWKHLMVSIFACFLHGDIKQKFNKVLDIVKTMWGASGQENDEVTRILNDENSEGYLKEIYDYAMNTRLAKIFMKMVEEFDISDLESEIDTEDPMKLLEMIKNPEHPTMKKFVDRIKNTIEEKMKRGELTQQLIQSEIEGIKAKVISLFGNAFGDMLGGRRGEHTPQVMMGNTPEARRQRMLARLQRKARDKNSK
jgi:hypothetical protein